MTLVFLTENLIEEITHSREVQPCQAASTATSYHLSGFESMNGDSSIDVAVSGRSCISGSNAQVLEIYNQKFLSSESKNTKSTTGFSVE